MDMLSRLVFPYLHNHMSLFLSSLMLSNKLFILLIDCLPLFLAKNPHLRLFIIVSPHIIFFECLGALAILFSVPSIITNLNFTHSNVFILVSVLIIKVISVSTKPLVECTYLVMLSSMRTPFPFLSLPLPYHHLPLMHLLLSLCLLFLQSLIPHLQVLYHSHLLPPHLPYLPLPLIRSHLLLLLLPLLFYWMN